MSKSKTENTSNDHHLIKPFKKGKTKFTGSSLLNNNIIIIYLYNKTAPVFRSPPALLSCTQAEVPLIQSWCPLQDQWQSSIGMGYRENLMEMDLLAPARRR